MKSRVEHYKNQRDALGYFLLEVIGVSYDRLGKILGVTRQAAQLQFPSRKKGLTDGH
jgi:hypothetical protein